ncbi:DUF6678 family protein [Tenacibaculum finnmarkense]|uniref:DUF6678 family protein n=1 Tax=Tenacibaculum finnmarkense TaxID=2781243 RepID=UPI001EFB1522|nr:DUF6678 family protein [Tenacibaculum finnmarkense]MCG8831499.1 hypothetical protein [Tenacibaculum finnmarkense]
MTLTEKNIENIIRESNFSSFMNNTKWEKLFENLIEEFDSVFIRFKLIGSEKIEETEFDMVDFSPYFIEPVLYKEIEWIEFPQKMLMIKNKRISRQTVSEYNQDTSKIENLINEIGIFDLEMDNGVLRLYGYK